MGRVGTGEHRPSFLEENVARKKRWNNLTEDLNPYKRKVLETILDNTRYNWLENEGGTTTTKDIAQFTTYGFPLIRRVFPNLIANELVSVQPY